MEEKPKKTSIVCKKTSTGKASTTIEDSRSYRIVLDVFGYKKHELTLTITSKNSLVVEGQSEITQDGRVSTKTFKKPYQIPDHVDILKVTATLTENGSVTLCMPRKDYKEKPEDINNPLPQPKGESIKVKNSTRKRK